MDCSSKASTFAVVLALCYHLPSHFSPTIRRLGLEKRSFSLMSSSALSLTHIFHFCVQCLRLDSRLPAVLGIGVEQNKSQALLFLWRPAKKIGGARKRRIKRESGCQLAVRSPVGEGEKGCRQLRVPGSSGFPQLQSLALCYHELCTEE